MYSKHVPPPAEASPNEMKPHAIEMWTTLPVGDSSETKLVISFSPCRLGAPSRRRSRSNTPDRFAQNKSFFALQWYPKSWIITKLGAWRGCTDGLTAFVRRAASISSLKWPLLSSMTSVGRGCTGILKARTQKGRGVWSMKQATTRASEKSKTTSTAL